MIRPGIFACLIFASILVPSAWAQRVYVGPGGIGFSFGDTPDRYYPDAFGRYGYDRYEYDRFGYDRYGYDRYPYNRYGYDRFGYDPYDYRRYGGSGFRWGIELNVPRDGYRDVAPYYPDLGRRPDVQRAPALPQVPSPEQRPHLLWAELRGLMKMGVENLQSSLDRFETGPGWQRHLRLGELQDHVAEVVNQPPTAAEAESLNEILSVFDSTADKHEFRAIHNKWGFQMIHASLAEYLRPPVERQWQLLADSKQLFDQQVARYRTGDTWQDYLQVPAWVLSESYLQPSDEDRQQLSELMQRMEKVDSDDQYAMIAKLPAFQDFRQDLQLMLQLLAPAAPVE